MPKLLIIFVRSPLTYSQTFLHPRYTSFKTSCPAILRANPASYINRAQWDEYPGCSSLSSWIILGPSALCTFSPPDMRFKQPKLSAGCRSGQVPQGMTGWWDPASHQAVVSLFMSLFKQSVCKSAAKEDLHHTSQALSWPHP